MRFQAVKSVFRSVAFLVLGAAYASSQRTTAPHMDHEPKHGGVFFMAPDRIHHLEGVLLPGGTFKVYLFDEYTRPIAATGFAALMQVDGGSEAGRLELYQDPMDGTLSFRNLPVSSFPVDLTVWITFPARGGAPPRTDLFSFSFPEFSSARKN